ncbi:MAG: hypothetical protein CMM84_04140 [Rhodothermaceae bacterium]|nr:hypothetical protein [Rhodothermaceae bacterium]MBC14068.1 hypothetical protein [Rhodothermaceae bacterium]
MPSAPVTVATCTYVFEAEILRGYLRSEGIEPRLDDAEIITADWTMSVAVGGVKVGVAPDQADRARHLLAAPADPFEDDDPHSPAEAASWRALTGALISPLFLGTLFGVYNLGRVIATADGESARTWRRTGWAAVFLLPWLLAVVGFGL